MTKQRYCRLITGLAMIAVLGFYALAQEKNVLPELSVAGVKLADKESAKAFLSGYSPRKTDDGRAVYYFYNEFGTQVMKLTAESSDDPFFITEIEVFSVGAGYQNQHYVAKDFGVFSTENNIFIGSKQSASSMIFGAANRTGPKEVLRKKGTPSKQEKTGESEIITYDLAKIKLSDGEFDYYARFEFSKSRLKKFILRITAEKPSEKK
jgi:hypothetical protein